MATLGERIQEARRKAGYPNAESLAVAMGVGVRTVQRWEGNKSEPKLAQLAQLAQLTKRPLSFFLKDLPLEEAARA